MSKTQREQVEIITRSGRHLLQLLNSILDVSKIESGSYELELAPLSLATLVDDVLELQGPRAAEKRVEPSAFVDPALPSHACRRGGAGRPPADPRG